jgi:hypothetical protein
MSGYEWQGSGQFGGFARKGNRRRHVPGDKARGRRLGALLAAELFWCEHCRGRHRLDQMRDCQARL